jgi:hypothetical protein
MRSKLIIIAIAALTLTTTAASAYNEVKPIFNSWRVWTFKKPA